MTLCGIYTVFFFIALFFVRILLDFFFFAAGQGFTNKVELNWMRVSVRDAAIQDFPAFLVWVSAFSTSPKDKSVLLKQQL